MVPPGNLLVLEAVFLVSYSRIGTDIAMKNVYDDPSMGYLFLTVVHISYGVIVVYCDRVTPFGQVACFVYKDGQG